MPCVMIESGLEYTMCHDRVGLEYAMCHDRVRLRVCHVSCDRVRPCVMLQCVVGGPASCSDNILITTCDN